MRDHEDRIVEALTAALWGCVIAGFIMLIMSAAKAVLWA